MNEITGFLLINKPEDISSAGCIKHLKRILQQKVKIGHAGTLDPFATGLLIVAIGRKATRELDQLMKLPKEYVATGKLGEQTDTLDKTGKVIEEKECEEVTVDRLKEALHAFGDAYEQIPPIYSALKIKGIPLYKLARQGTSVDELQKVVEQKKRVVQLHDLALEQFTFPLFTIRACVSHGTYIRTLINDIAKQVDCIATTYDLVRTKIGPFSVEQSVMLDNIKTIEDIQSHLFSVYHFLSFI